MSALWHCEPSRRVGLRFESVDKVPIPLPLPPKTRAPQGSFACWESPVGVEGDVAINGVPMGSGGHVATSERVLRVFCP
jgi:hypothetical protein